ncbi:MAG TPA: trypsin-like peptidase domain-containing protein [Tepidisphaeraceae bacterium]|nr:trypsin-like peptidase domain-containing protein [Tepidisphaeraceae bacterium]
MTSMKPFKKSLAVVLLGGGAVGGFFGANALQSQWSFGQNQASQKQVNQAEDLATVFRDIGKKVEPSVVEIVVHKTVKAPKGVPLPDDMLRRFFPNQPGLPNLPNQPNQPDGPDENGGGDEQGGMEQVGTGSGVILEVDGKTGYILTNNHVAGGATEITVTLADGRRIDNAKVLGADPKSDLAVVKIEADDLKAVNWGDSTSLQQGDWIMAFGAPFGYVGSMTHGIVSALNRTNVGILGRQGYEDFIQVDAPINPGNSGGPLVNLHGDVVGINTAIASRSGGFQGIGFAIPINEARFVYNQLKDHGKVTRGFLGVAIGDIARQPDVAKGLGYSKSTGVLVQQTLPGSPATGKLQPYDVITSINGKPVQNTTQLRNQIAMEAPGAEVTLSVFRNGKNEDVQIKLGEQPENMLASRNETVTPNAPAAKSTEALGMKLATPTEELAQKFGLQDNSQGALVTAVTPRSPAEKAGLVAGDVITQVDRKPIKSADEATSLITKHGKGPILLYVTNAEGGHIVAIEPKH